MNNILSIDVEDWFHIMETVGTPEVKDWDGLESRVERGFEALISELAAANTLATFFFLGWIAERHPQLVRRAHELGHEIASHGRHHQPVFRQSPQEFAADIRDSKHRLEDLIGAPVHGYRAPGFSIVRSTPWALEEVAAAGFQYDSSIFPAARVHGGISDGDLAPHVLRTASGDLEEYPATVVEILGRRLCLFGGGYFRLFPYPLIQRMSQRVNADGRPVIFYLHPREIDVGHPRLPMSPTRRFKSYVNVDGTLPKLRRLLRQQRLVPFRDWRAGE